eukprot:1069123-Rhodomonas_salina.3
MLTLFVDECVGYHKDDGADQHCQLLLRLDPHEVLELLSCSCARALQLLGALEVNVNGCIAEAGRHPVRLCLCLCYLCVLFLLLPFSARPAGDQVGIHLAKLVEVDCLA